MSVFYYKRAKKKSTSSGKLYSAREKAMYYYRKAKTAKSKARMLYYLAKAEYFAKKTRR